MCLCLWPIWGHGPPVEDHRFRDLMCYHNKPSISKKTHKYEEKNTQLHNHYSGANILNFFKIFFSKINVPSIEHWSETKALDVCFNELFYSWSQSASHLSLRLPQHPPLRFQYHQHFRAQMDLNDCTSWHSLCSDTSHSNNWILFWGI